jgi:hypothetical protein
LLHVKLLVRDGVDALQDQRLAHAEAEDATSREYSRKKKKILKLCASRTPQAIRIIAVAHMGGYLLE